jgi:ion channel-forming bestrophin family protein
MVNYNPKDFVKGIFQLHKADTIRKLFPFLVFIGIYGWLVCFVELEYLKLSKDSNLKNILQLHTLLGFAISMLLVFRTNTAYDRWWEGRKLWGALVNNSRNLAFQINAMLPVDETYNRKFFEEIIPLFARELKKHLQSEKTRLALDEQVHPDLMDLDNSKHIPNQITNLLQKKVQQLYQQQKIDGFQLQQLTVQLHSFADICGACERIKNTPIPYSYSVFLKKFIFLYVLTLPLGLVFNLGYITIPVVMFFFYVLASLELIAEEIEDPFGSDTNDLPMAKMADNIQKNIQEILA